MTLKIKNYHSEYFIYFKFQIVSLHTILTLSQAHLKVMIQAYLYVISRLLQDIIEKDIRFVHKKMTMSEQRFFFHDILLWKLFNQSSNLIVLQTFFYGIKNKGYI